MGRFNGVARMQCNEIRGLLFSGLVFPESAGLYPGYALTAEPSIKDDFFPPQSVAGQALFILGAAPATEKGR